MELPGGQLSAKASEPSFSSNVQKTESNDDVKDAILTDFAIEEIAEKESEYNTTDTPITRGMSVFNRLSLSAYSLGYGNMLMTPKYFVIYGRGAFLIPLFLSYILVGFPILLIEAVIGQYSALHPNIVFSRISPILNSIGGMYSIISFYRGIYFMPFAANTLYIALEVVIMAFQQQRSCESSYCIVLADIDRCKQYWENEDSTYEWMSFPANCTKTYHQVLNSTNIMRIGVFTDYVDHHVYNLSTIKIEYTTVVLLFGLWGLLAVIVVYLPTKIGHISSVIGVVGLVLTFIVFGYAVYHIGELDLLWSDFFKPDFERLLYPPSWTYAVALTLFSLSLCDGGVIRMTSRNPFNNNVFFDVLLTMAIDIVVSLMHIYIFNVTTAGIITELYPGIKNAAAIQNIMTVLQDAYLLSAFGQFVIRKSSPLVAAVFCLLYYGCLAMLVFQSVLVSYEILLAAVIRRLKITRNWQRALVICALCFCSSVICIYLLTPHGTVFVTFFLQAGVFFVALVGAVEVIALMFFYGYRNFCANIENMIGWRPTFIHYIEVVIFKGITPAILGGNFVALVINVVDKLVTDREGSESVVSLVIIFTGFIITPIYIAIQLFKMYRENRKYRVLFMPSSDWGRYRPVMQDEAFTSVSREDE